MVHRPRATLSRVMDDLGSTLLEVVAGRVDPATGVGGVVFHDPLDPPDLAERALVLGVGLAGAEEIASVIREIGKADAAGLVVRVPVETSRAVRDAVRDTGVVLFGLTRGASWAQVATLLRSLLAVDDLGGGDDGETLAGAAAGDLFALAGAVSELLGGPVTIEDLNSRVLAFSADQGRADEPRKETVLGRQVPERYTRELERRGVFRALYGSDQPVYVTGLAGVDLPRVAVRIRAGDEVLGSIWAAVTGPLSREREQAFIDSAKLVALHILRQRAGADVERRLRAELVATLLEGGPSATEAAGRLGLAAGSSCVLALTVREHGDASRLEAELQRIRGAFALHLAAVHPRSAAALVGGVVYGVIPLAANDAAADRRAVAVAREFLGRIRDHDAVVIGIGRIAQDASELPRSRADADRALRVLRHGQVPSQVARSEDVWAASILLELGDLLAAERQEPSGPVARLAAYDVRHRGVLVETLRAWLDAFGDVRRAAAALHVHPNTFRYRLRRIGEVGGIDLEDPEARFAAMLELRLSPRTQRYREPSWFSV
ncbi:PucR family transcriptional regulator [Phytoactinopolyspora halotolerans]|uniref:PucR family transcriptional regulator n=1 Tax=Phytoactinopolyspora halotolerans TaxID=1981512 RepID=A0A6L9SE29_9ACTN|nr:helix-turn-helix domain-containing protein [Phytoactinopolyspora halotolerans]NEE02762.1 PucR family transcriptional regulator [Phytoactinopolyspora halotolerans]